MSVIVELAVGDPRSGLSLADADVVAAVARQANVSGIRLLDHPGEGRTIDSSIVGAYLAGRHSDLGYLVDAWTTHNAPYNLARRILSFDRATNGRSGVVLRPGAGDEVSDAAIPDPSASDPAHRWAEYAGILAGLWESFPAGALLGDQARAVVAEDSLIRPIDHEGRFYRVAGPLDGPSSVQGRPPIVVADPDVLGWQRVVASADAVIVENNRTEEARDALTAALKGSGRAQEDIALLARVNGGDNVAVHRAVLSDNTVDGLLVGTNGLGVSAIVDRIQTLAPQIVTPAGRTFRSSLGLRETAKALA